MRNLRLGAKTPTQIHRDPQPLESQHILSLHPRHTGKSNSRFFSKYLIFKYYGLRIQGVYHDILSNIAIYKVEFWPDVAHLVRDVKCLKIIDAFQHMLTTFRVKDVFKCFYFCSVESFIPSPALQQLECIMYSKWGLIFRNLLGH